MPKTVLARRENFNLIAYLVGILLIVSLVCAVVDASLFLYSQNLDKEISNQTNIMTKMTTEENEANALRVVEQKIKYKEDVLKKIDDQSTSVSKLLKDIEGITPKDVSIEDLTFNGGVVSIKGKADKEESVLDMYHSLKVKNLTDSIDFSTITGIVGDAKGFDFSFSFKLNGGK